MLEKLYSIKSDNVDNIFYEIDCNFITDLILKNAKYQKVVCLIDSKTNLNFVETFENSLKKETIFFVVNVDCCDCVENMINDGTKLIITLLSDENFLKFSEMFFENVNHILVLKNSGIIIPYLVFLDKIKIFFNQDFTISQTDLFFLFNNLINYKWNNLVAGKSSLEIENVNEIGEIFLEKNVSNFIDKFMEKFKNAKFYVYRFLSEFDFEDFDNVLYIILLLQRFLFEGFKNENYFMPDIYKDYSNDMIGVEDVFNLYNNERVLFLLKNASNQMLDYILKIEKFISNNYKINIKNKNLIKTILISIKRYAIAVKSDNLIKYSYLFGILNAI